MATLILLSITILAFLVGLGLQQHQRRSLPKMGASEFVSSFRREEGAGYTSEEILAARGKVASYLGVAPDLLRPDDSIQELVERTDLLSDVRVGWGDLIDDVSLIQVEKGGTPGERMRSIRQVVQFFIENSLSMG